MKKKIVLLALVTLIEMSFLSACKKDNETASSKDLTVTEYAKSDQNFSILVQALTKANLADVLNGSGNFTVFAPTNDAFNALFKQLGVTGITDLSASTLTPILLYHVLGEEKMASMLSTGYYSTLSPAQGSYNTMYISTSMGVSINKDTKVTLADVDVKNGVIHAIDKVLLPPTVVDQALDNSNFSILVQAVVKAGLVETLNGAGPFTIFAPTDAAFQELFMQLGVSGIADLTAAQLVPILKYHVVSGNIRSTQLKAGTVTTLNGPITVTLMPSPEINGTTKIVATDVQASNGVIHVIDKVLLPSSK
jgi:transforming growth factor-beta-induced protein